MRKYRSRPIKIQSWPKPKSWQPGEPEHLCQTSLLVSLAILAGLVYLFWGAFDWDAPRLDPVEGTTAAVGESIFSRFILPFEVVSFLLLAALIGAIVLSRRDDRP